MPICGGEHVNIKVKLSLKGNLTHFGKKAGDVVTVPFEDYIKAVVSSEISNAPLEACKAQAVAARTFAYPSARDGKVISDSGGSDQAFIAARMTNRKNYPNAHQAVEDTTGQILAYQDKPIGKHAHFSSANNGTTKNKRYKWPNEKDQPYLPMQPDPWTTAELARRKAAGEQIKFGHGVGMSQYGAMYAARQGVGYQNILAFYYPGTTLMNTGGYVPANVMVPQAIPYPDPPPAPEATVKSQALILAERMTDYARSKVGGKYVFSASGPVNFDCSGLLKRIGEILGLELYHGATTLWLRGFQSGNPKRYGYWADSGTIDTLPEDAPAVVLFNQDKTETRHLVMAHTGYYDGLTGNVIQAGGYGGRGVHENKLDKRRWTHWAIFKGTVIGGSEQPMNNILRRGSVGQAVREMQAALLARGFDLGSYGADGKFGPKTETAVMAYQRLHGLTVSGAWGADEQAKLCYQPTAQSDSTTDTVTIALPRDMAKVLAEALRGVL
jgi:hypothetical protein